jgi:H+-transporting ATPase
MSNEKPQSMAAGTDADLEKIPVEQVLAKLGVQAERGLSSTEAQQRFAQYGPNSLVEKEESLAAKILGHFMGPIAYMIEAAALVSALIGHWDDFAIITFLLLFNVGLEMWQDRKASNALAELKKGLARRPPPCAMASGRRWRRRLWFRAISSRYVWA